MSLLENIQAAALAARKARDTVRATLLVTVYAEAARVGKDDGNRVSTEEEVLKTVKKFLTGVDDTIAHLEKQVQGASPEQKAQAQATRDARMVELTAEKNILMEFLPAQVSTDTLKAYITEQVSLLSEKSPKQMGALMKQLKERFGVNYDATVASGLVKAALSV